MDRSDFARIVQREGWSDRTQIDLLLRYIETQTTPDAFHSFCEAQRADTCATPEPEPLRQSRELADPDRRVIVYYTVTGTLSVPKGSDYLPGSRNLIRIPDGQIVAVHPVIELESCHGADDHRNLTYSEALAVGVTLEDYDQTSDIDQAECADPT